MSKINHFFTKAISTFTFSVPSAIILGSIIIAGSIITSGLIISGRDWNRSNTAGTQGIKNPLPAMLKTIGINDKAFTTCLTTGAMAATVSESVTDGMQAGVDGTPSTFVVRIDDNVPYVIANISGAVSYEMFKQAIDQGLSGKVNKNLPVFKGKLVTAQEIEGGAAPSNVFVIEYSDLECPFCTRLHDTMKKVRTDYAGKISFVYRNFPLTSIHQHAQKEAEMLSCAFSIGGEKAMYPLMDALFSYKIKNNAGYIPTEEN